MNNEKFWKDTFNQYGISMKDNDSLDEKDDFDGPDSLFTLLLEEDEYYPTPDGFEGMCSPCCDGQIILLYNKYTNQYLGICEDCNRDLFIFSNPQFIIHDLKLIKE